MERIDDRRMAAIGRDRLTCPPQRGVPPAPGCRRDAIELFVKPGVAGHLFGQAVRVKGGALAWCNQSGLPTFPGHWTARAPALALAVPEVLILPRRRRHVRRDREPETLGAERAIRHSLHRHP